MARCYLHIGLTKTGTTAIQKFMYKNRDRLLNKFKIWYPDAGLQIVVDIPLHHFMAHSLLKGSSTFEECIHQLRQEINYKRPEVVVISSEAFMQLESEDSFNKLRYSFNSLFGEVYIIVYLRRQDLWIESAYLQQIKDWSVRESSHFDAFLSQYLQKESLLRYDKFLKKWQLYFPEAKIIPRIYDTKNFPNGNILFDFLSVLGINALELRDIDMQIKANISIRPMVGLVLRKINSNKEIHLTPDEYKDLIRFLSVLEKENEFSVQSLFTLEERVEFLEHFKESNEKLFKEWFNSENKFLLSEEEIKFYKEQDKISREKIEKFVESMYGKVLTYLMSKKKLNCAKIDYSSVEEVELVSVDVLYMDLLKFGSLNIGGLVLLKKDIKGDYRLILKQGEEEKEITWGINSPFLAERYPDNPKAKNARFQMSWLAMNKDKPLEIYLRKENFDKLLIRIYINP